MRILTTIMLTLFAQIVSAQWQQGYNSAQQAIIHEYDNAK